VVTRAGMAWTAIIAALVLLVLLIAFIVQNQDAAGVRFFGPDGTISLGIALLIAAVGGGALVAVAGAVRIIQLRARTRLTSATRRSPGRRRPPDISGSQPKQPRAGRNGNSEAPTAAGVSAAAALTWRRRSALPPAPNPRPNRQRPGRIAPDRAHQGRTSTAEAATSAALAAVGLIDREAEGQAIGRQWRIGSLEYGPRLGEPGQPGLHKNRRR
jgi:uncharacterized integral membrane protein